MREATCSILQNAGFEVLPAGDAYDAMTVYEERRWAIDLVITDGVLPGRTGEQLGEDLRQRSSELMVLITSGYGNLDYDDFEDNHQANQAVPKSRTYFLPKPYSRKTLIDKIEPMLGTGVVALSRPAKQAKCHPFSSQTKSLPSLPRGDTEEHGGNATGKKPL